MLQRYGQNSQETYTEWNIVSCRKQNTVSAVPTVEATEAVASAKIDVAQLKFHSTN